jgi:YfiH family protein
MSARDPRWDPQWIVPDWPVAPAVRALLTTRAGGGSRGPFGAGAGHGGLNLGLGSGLPQVAADDPAQVARNRARLAALLPQAPCWLHQVHGAEVVDAGRVPAGTAPAADGAWTTRPGVVCGVLVADCLPVLLAEAGGRGVAAAHAGWRGLAAGVLQNTARALRQGLGDPAARLLAYLGPAIGPQRFVVGAEVLEQMQARLPEAPAAFAEQGGGRYLADLYALARQALAQAQVDEVHGGGLCTVSDPQRFYSFRRDRVTGRQAALIWLDAAQPAIA